jgi:hypothetical protein
MGIILGVRPNAVYMPGSFRCHPGREFTSSPTASLKQTIPPKRCSARHDWNPSCALPVGLEVPKSSNRFAATVRGFVGNAVPFDDITMLAIRRLDPVSL